MRLTLSGDVTVILRFQVGRTENGRGHGSFIKGAKNRRLDLLFFVYKKKNVCSLSLSLSLVFRLFVGVLFRTALENCTYLYDDT